MEAWLRKRITELGADTCVGCWMGYIVDDMPYSYICGIDGQGWLAWGFVWITMVFMKKIFTIIAHTLVLLSCSVYRLCGALYPASSEKRCTIRYHRRSPISLKLITLTSLASSMTFSTTTLLKGPKSSSSSSSSSSYNDEAPTLSKLLPSSTLNVANSI